MTFTFDLGEKSTLADNPGNILPLAVHPGDSIVVSNVAGDTLNVLGNGLIGGATSTIAASANATFTTPTYLQSQGRTSCSIKGGLYGN